MPKFFVISFYKFFEDLDLGIKSWFMQACRASDMKGTILLAREGINGSLEGSAENVDLFLKDFLSHPLFTNIPIKKSVSDGKAFNHLWIKIKKEIVTFRQPGLNPAKITGHFVSPENWDVFIQNPDVITIDTRNFYEYEVGSFKGAINPNTRSFGQFPDFIEKNREQFKNKKIAMYCTGGIRCEKASAYLIQQGITDVYQLEGGILNYFEKIPHTENKWQGECIVFDHRWSLNKELEKGSVNEPSS